MKRLLFLGMLLPTFLTIAGTIQVTTTNDVLDLSDCSNITNKGGDGLLSLREAVCLANNNKGPDTITLPSGDFVLSLGAVGDDNNDSGDLDITDELTIVGQSDGSTTISNGFGDAMIDGDGDRLFDLIGSDVNPYNLTLRHLTLKDADLSCTGNGCISGGGVINFSGLGTLTLNTVHATNNQNGCVGNDCGGDENTAVITMNHGGTLELLNSTMDDNRTYCQFSAKGGPTSCYAGSIALHAKNGSKESNDFNLTITNSNIINNHASCDLDNCHIESIIDTTEDMDYGTINISNSLISNNSLSCQGIGCSVGSILYSRMGSANVNLNGLAMNQNRLECTGTDCDTDYLIRILGIDFFEKSNAKGDQLPYNLLIHDSEFNHNTLTCSGEECTTDELMLIDESEFTQITNTSIQHNELSCFGFDCDTDELLELCCSAGSYEIENLLVAHNLNRCEGNECDTDEIVDLGSDVPNTTVTVNNSMVIDNEVSCVGQQCECDVAGIHLRAPDGTNVIMNSTIARNTSDGDDGECLFRASGGLLNDGFNTTVTNTTIHGNRSVGSGAGILNSGNLVLDHVTITDNVSDTDNNGRGFGSGICSSFNFQGTNTCGTESGSDNATVTMSNTILDNQNTAAPDCYGLIESTGSNVINDATNCFISGAYTAAAANMLPLADNGCVDTLYGGTCVETQLAPETSPVIDAGDCASGIFTDQRGVNRPFDVTAVNDVNDGCDIGAVESFSDLIFINGFE